MSVGIDDRGAAHTPAGAAGHLPGGVRSAADDRSDLAKRHREHVMQDEGEALVGRQGLEDDEQRQTDRVRKLRRCAGSPSTGSTSTTGSGTQLPT